MKTVTPHTLSKIMANFAQAFVKKTFVKGDIIVMDEETNRGYRMSHDTSLCLAVVLEMPEGDFARATFRGASDVPNDCLIYIASGIVHGGRGIDIDTRVVDCRMYRKASQAEISAIDSAVTASVRLSDELQRLVERNTQPNPIDAMRAVGDMEVAAG